MYAVGGASLLGGFLYHWHAELPILLTIVFNALGLLITLFVTEPSRHQERPHRNPFVDMMQTLRYALHGHAEIAGIIFLSGVLFAGTKVLLWAQQPYYIFLDLPVKWFGLLSACGFLLGGLASHYSHLSKGLKDDRSLFLFLLDYSRVGLRVQRSSSWLARRSFTAIRLPRLGFRLAASAECD